MAQKTVPQTVGVDADGNTLFHQKADSAIGAEALDRLASLVDVNQANNAGRIPLHNLCSMGWYDIWLDADVVDQTQWFLRHTANIDSADANGVRPLHLASMSYPYLVKALLAAGADPAGTTFEGMIPLHLAARARQSNITGLLIAVLEAASLSGNSSLSDLLNARDQTGRSPIHHACRSGRYETVCLLLAAGADVCVQDEQGWTVLDACAEFADEQLLWADYRKPDKQDWDFLTLLGLPFGWNCNVIVGTGMYDRLRPWIVVGKVAYNAYTKSFGEDNEGTFGKSNGGLRSCQDTTRLYEILQMLHQAAQAVAKPESLTRFIQNLGRCVQKLESAITDDTDDGIHRQTQTYALRCFRDFAAELSDTRSVPLPLHDQQDDTELLKSLPTRFGYNNDGSYVDEGTVNLLLMRREYGVIERLLRRSSPLCLTPDKAYHAGKILRLFAKLGFAHLIATILESNPADTLRELFSKDELRGKPADQVLFLACQRELPNMDVVRLLVESGYVDINGQSRTNAEYEASGEHTG
ncbi:ankyrin unc44 [Grosmannia clavigera kw1407]|uniref:Ankyrin unc44 n=1 Tax=Grosmannia clavigera (strain kw1407 / UAMH 11150) TaxID=655863 RepID=F0XKU6_GROCL|nr:ankyrin unc44 [Grosmannia clavigera kw1407]EFX01750.1 ankyrin unc44 [Grosmannia clavigera kw1407]